jgi:hypothetical protein
MFPDETEPEQRPTAGHHEDAEAVRRAWRRRRGCRMRSWRRLGDAQEQTLALGLAGTRGRGWRCARRSKRRARTEMAARPRSRGRRATELSSWNAWMKSRMTAAAGRRAPDESVHDGHTYREDTRYRLDSQRTMKTEGEKDGN